MATFKDVEYAISARKEGVQVGPLCQLQDRLDRIKESLAATRAHLTASVNSLAGGQPEEQDGKNPGPVAIPDGLVSRLTELCEQIQGEISRLDFLAQRLGGLL